MKVVILCGGLGTRLSEETSVKPKPMVDIGGYPMLWHIMQMYSHYGFKDFILALGYKGHYIKDYFLNYSARSNDFKIDMATGNIQHYQNNKMDWQVELVDTGDNSMTGGRLYHLKDKLINEENFMLTYGDGVADVNLADLVKYHHQQAKAATVTAVRPSARFGCMKIQDNLVTEFKEKPQTDQSWINGGFFVFTPKVFSFLNSLDDVLEGEPLEGLARSGDLSAFQHEGFWQCMDTLRDKNHLEELWQQDKAPWWYKKG